MTTTPERRAALAEADAELERLCAITRETKQRLIALLRAADGGQSAFVGVFGYSGTLPGNSTDGGELAAARAAVLRAEEAEQRHRVRRSRL